MPNNNFCNKCGKRHFPPKGKKCKHAKKVLNNSNNDINVISDHGVLVEGASDSNDFVVMPQVGVPVFKNKTGAGLHTDSDTTTAAKVKQRTQSPGRSYNS